MPRRNRSRPTQRQVAAPCRAKVSYSSRRAAEKAIAERRRLNPDTPDLAVYICTNCGSWHMTSSRR